MNVNHAIHRHNTSLPPLEADIYLLNASIRGYWHTAKIGIVLTNVRSSQLHHILNVTATSVLVFKGIVCVCMTVTYNPPVYSTVGICMCVIRYYEYESQGVLSRLWS